MEEGGDEFAQNGRGPANWRDTIVRKDASFPVRKMSLGGHSVPSDMLSEKDYELQPQITGGSVYSYESKYTTVTGGPRSNRTSRASLHDQRLSRTSVYDQRVSRNSYYDQGASRSSLNDQRASRSTSFYDQRASRTSLPGRPLSAGATSLLSSPDLLLAPQAVHSNGLLGSNDLFGQSTPSTGYSPQSRISPSGLVLPQTDYFGAIPSNSTLLSANSAYAGPSSATSPPPAASRSSVARKSVHSVVIPSPLGQVISLPDVDGAKVAPQRPNRRKSRTVSFADDGDFVVSSRHSVHSVRSNHSGHSRSNSSPPRNRNPSGSVPSASGRSSLQLPPGAREAHELMPPMPSLYSRAMAAGHDASGPAPFPAPRVSWNGEAYSSGGGQPFAPAFPSSNPYPPTGSELELPDGAYPPNHPIALAHQKLSCAATATLPMPSTPPAFSFANPPTTPPAFSPTSSYATPQITPPAILPKSRAPTSPGYPSRFSRSPSASASIPTPRNRDVSSPSCSSPSGHSPPSGYAKVVHSGRSAEREDSNSSENSSENTGSSSPPSSTPPTSQSNHYSTAPSSPRGVSGRRPKGHAKNTSSGSSRSPPSSPGHSSSSHRSLKRGLWFDSIDETNRPVAVAVSAAPRI